MTLLRRIAAWFMLPELKGIDPDDPAILPLQARIYKSKSMIQVVLGDIYQRCFRLENTWSKANGKRLEIGSGISVVKEFDPEIISSDIRESEYIDRIVDAQVLDVEESEYSLILGIHVFHHLSDPSVFFDRVNKVLQEGGILILVEPWHGPLASILYRHLFRTESFDKKQAEWTGIGNGPMRGANQALSYLVFRRDLHQFQREWPELVIRQQDVFGNYLQYLFTGGLNFRQLLPDCCFFVIRVIEKVLYPFRRILGLHQIIVLRKEIKN